jgi:hypothetical protein
MTTTDNTATDWRDLKDQLTAEQIVRLENGRHMQPGELLDIARDMAAQNLLQAAHADVPLPDGVTATSWYDDGGAHRTVYGGRWTVGTVIVAIVGGQDTAGAIAWQIEVQPVDGTVGALCAHQCRELSAVLAVAADRLDQLTGTAPPFV